MRKSKLLITLSFLILQSMTVFSQTGKISGMVTSVDERVVEAATVSLIHSADSSVVKIEVTDKNGLYEFEKITPGKYKIKIDAVGYKTIVTDELQLSVDKTSVTMTAVKLAQASNSLNGVNVVSKRPLIENKIDKTVVNVDASPTNTGLTALEVLEKSPGITIDNNDNISLRGKQGVKIFIDGKPSYLSGQDLTNYLKSLSANQLDQIEIMTQPSAKYDASGNTGIINFRTKKNKSNGFNGTITTSAIIAKYFKNTNGISFNYRKNNINIFGNYGYSWWEGFNDINLDRKFRSDRESNFSSYSEQHTFGRYSGRPQNFKLGLDYTASKKTTLGFAISGDEQHDKFTSSSVANIFDSLHNLSQVNIAQSQSFTPWTNVGFNFNIQHKIDEKGKEISADADYIFYSTKGATYTDNYLYDPEGSLIIDPLNVNPYLLNGSLPAHIDIFSFKSDYSQPLKNNTKLEAGIKSSFVKTDNDAQYTVFDTTSGKWNPDINRSNHFIYKENINAAYINLNKQIKKFAVQLGLRAEQTIASGNQVSKDVSFKKNYTKIFPTAYFSYQKNDNNTFTLSYGRRIERPGYQDLNPFQFPLDRYTYQQGNPNLQPQFSHNIELGYNYKGQLNISANYTTVSGIINDVLITQKEGDNYVTFQTKENIASNQNAGLAVSYGKQLKKWWMINIYANAFYNHYEGAINGEHISLGLASYNSNFSSQFTFNKGWSAEFSGFYQGENLVSSNILAQPMGMFSLGAGKKILKDKGSVRLNLRDPFYLMHFTGSTELDKFTTNVKSTWDNRRVIISFSYRFGKSTVPQQRRRASGADDEKSRINTGGQQ